MKAALLTAGMVIALGCGPSGDDEPCGAARVSAPLFGASDDPLELERLEQNAVVALTESAEFASGGLCSGVLIDPRRVLTAAHCAELLPHAISAFVGPSVPGHEFRARVTDFEVHGEHDVAIALLEQPVPSDVAKPLAPIDEDVVLEVGDTAILVGYGLTEDDGLGYRLYLEEPIVEIEQESITVDGAGLTGACVGDSGGPLLVRDRDAHPRIAGVLSKGSASCLNIDVYQRLEPVMDWLELSTPDGC